MIPRVSIIIRTHNRADMLIEAVTSALKQDYPNLEVIVSDDASSDHTMKVIQSFTNDPRFRYFRNNEHMKLSAHLKKACFEYASGDWVLILDDDDYLLDNSYISKAIEFIQSNDKIVMVHSNCKVLINDTGKLIDTYKELPAITEGKWMFLNYKYACYGNINCHTLTVIFNRQVAMAVKCFDDDTINIGEDRESWLKISLKGKIGFLNDLSAVYRVHGNNVSQKIDIDSFFSSLGSILNPYEFAKQEGCFDPHELKRWKQRMIRELCEIWLIGSLINRKHKIVILSKFIKRISKEYPFVLLSLFKIFKLGTLVRIALSAFNNLICFSKVRYRWCHSRLIATKLFKW